MSFVYLTKEDLVVIHGFIIQETGGLDGIRDHHALASAAELPKQQAFGQDLYQTAFVKAAAYARSIIMNHPFLDGNKRSGITAAGTFLDINGHLLHCKRGEIEKFAVRVVVEALTVEQIAQCLQKRSKKKR